MRTVLASRITLAISLLLPVVGLIGIFASALARSPQAISAAKKEAKTIDLTKIPSPRILPGDEKNHYRDPTAVFHDGVFRLFFTVNQPRDNKKYMVSFLERRIDCHGRRVADGHRSTAPRMTFWFD